MCMGRPSRIPSGSKDTVPRLMYGSDFVQREKTPHAIPNPRPTHSPCSCAAANRLRSAGLDRECSGRSRPAQRVLVLAYGLQRASTIAISGTRSREPTIPISGSVTVCMGGQAAALRLTTRVVVGTCNMRTALRRGLGGSSGSHQTNHFASLLGEMRDLQRSRIGASPCRKRPYKPATKIIRACSAPKKENLYFLCCTSALHGDGWNGSFRHHGAH